MPGQVPVPHQLEDLSGSDYGLLLELVWVCRLFPSLQHLAYIPCDLEIHPFSEQYITRNQGYTLLKDASDDFFEELGLLEAVTHSHDNANSSDFSSSTDTSVPNTSIDGSDAASSHANTPNADSTEAADNNSAEAADNDTIEDDDDSDWLTESSVDSSDDGNDDDDDPIPAGASSSTNAHSTTPSPEPINTEKWLRIGLKAAQFGTIYKNNLPIGLDTLPLWEWSTYDLLLSSLAGTLRTFCRIQGLLWRVLRKAGWNGIWIWSLVYRAAAAQAAEDVHDLGGRARALAKSILGRILVLCCPWNHPAARIVWIEVAVGWIKALIEHQAKLERLAARGSGKGGRKPGGNRGRK